MKFPYQMLRDFVETKLDATAIGDLLTMAGFELEGIEEVEGDAVLDIKVVSNRGDGLSVFGLAREVLAKDADAKPTALYELGVRRFPLPDEGTPADARVDIETPDCTRYACRLFRDVPQGDSPEKLAKRLRQAGMRPISVLVDLTNYVMLEVGQPLHAFDMDLLAENRIVVRKARKGEKLTTLDGADHELSADQMMICDAVKPVAAAGIMGGLATEVTGVTKRMLLESAHFENISVRRTRKQLGLATEASHRFERSVDPDGVVSALNRFAMLLGEIDSGKSLVAGVKDVYPGKAARQPIHLSVQRASKLLGMEVSAADSKRYLERLGFGVEGKDPFTVTPPTWRPDVVREEDLVEEIGRVHGYDKIPEALPRGATLQGGVFGFEERVDRIRVEFVRLGFTQTMSHSLGDRHPLEEPGAQPIGPRIAASPEHAYLRSSLLMSLADVSRRNGGRDLHLFEMGRVFRGEGKGFIENRKLAAMSMGSLSPIARQNETAPQADFFSMKGAVLAALMAAGAPATLSTDGSDPRMHPTRQAAIQVDGKTVGRLGQIHPDVAEDASLPADAVLAELDLELALASAEPDRWYKPVSKNPAVRRDIAVLFDKSVAFERIESAVKTACGGVLEKMWLFDVYEGKGIPDGKHSLAIALQLRKYGENFTDEEANQVREKAVSALAQLGGTPR